MSLKMSLYNEKFFALVCIEITHSDVDRLFHYAIPEEIAVEISVGKRVRVPFGKGNALKIGFVMDFFRELPDVPLEKIKAIHSVCDEFSVLTAETIQLAFWMQKKYYTSLAACVRAITPGAKSDGRFPMARKKSAKSAGTKSSEAKGTASSNIVLTPEQQEAVAKINEIIKAGGMPPLLLHGVTGSGKTEVYLHVIEQVLKMGKQAIVLVPEIALTPQIVGLFTARFGGLVAVTHSRLTQGERFQIWKMARDSEIQLVIGPRSAVFAPFENLGLIVIDEEHEHTYHSELSPKYDAREIAVKRAELCGAAVVLGSATPSLESYYRATAGKEAAKPLPATSNASEEAKAEFISAGAGGIGGIAPIVYELAQLTQRVNKTLPEIHIVDMRKEMARGNTSIFSKDFQGSLAETLENGKQAILFLNRRGYSSYVSCRWCGHVMTCDSCRVNHTYHADKGRLLCHYCGKGQRMPQKCPICESEHIKRHGTGTQKIEEEIAEIFPGVKTLRMDMDTTKGKFGHAKILSAFQNGEAQILIGTQMVAKGLDFPNVTMVGVIAADMSLYTGDFRSGEYTFQLLTQVAGRAGRAVSKTEKETKTEETEPLLEESRLCPAERGGFGGRAPIENGKVYIQTYSPEHYAVSLAQTGDYEKFFKYELGLRKAMVYPPFSHVFSIMLTGPVELDVINALRKLMAIMDYCIQKDGKNRFELLGLSPAFVSMVKRQFRWKLLVKCKEEAPLVAFVLYCIKKLKENDALKNMNFNLTLNPIMME